MGRCTDDGAATTCGTLSRALLQASGAITISFNLAGGSSTVAVTGALPPVQANVLLTGSSCTGTGIITLDGSSAAALTNGLILKGGASVQNLKIRGFQGRQIMASSSNLTNFLSCVKALRF